MKESYLERYARPVSLSFSIIVAGCSGPAIKSTALVPAKFDEAAGIKRIAVLPFQQGRRANADITADVEASIASIQVEGRPYFQVIERRQLHHVIEEQRLGSSGLIDIDTVVRVGKLIGVDGILMGTITEYDVHKVRFQGKERRCTREDRDGDCKKWANVSVPCTEYTATFAFVPKLVNVSTGRLAGTDSISRQSSVTACGRISAPNQSDLMRVAKDEALSELNKTIAPHYVTQDIVLITKDESSPPPAVKAQLDSGVAFAKAGRLDRACSLWEEAGAVHPRGYALPYLRGVCAESRGDLFTARRYYLEADAQTTKPVLEINQALERLDQQSSDKMTLRKQMRRTGTSSPAFSPQIQRAQMRLAELGYAPGPADGIFGSQTEAAIRRFQNDQGIPETSRLDSKTRRQLGIE